MHNPLRLEQHLVCRLLLDSSKNIESTAAAPCGGSGRVAGDGTDMGKRRAHPAGGHGSVAGLLPPAQTLLPVTEGLCRVEVFSGERRPVPLLGNSRQRWGEPRQAHARRALPGCPTQAVSSATTRRPDSAASVAGGLCPVPWAPPERVLDPAAAAPARLVPGSPALCRRLERSQRRAAALVQLAA